MNPTDPLTRREFFALNFALKLMHVKEVAPGKLAVPRNSGKPQMAIQCEMGVAVQMADDLGALLDSTPVALRVVEPEKEPEANDEGPKQQDA